MADNQFIFTFFSHVKSKLTIGELFFSMDQDDLRLDWYPEGNTFRAWKPVYRRVISNFMLHNSTDREGLAYETAALFRRDYEADHEPLKRYVSTRIDENQLVGVGPNGLARSMDGPNASYTYGEQTCEGRFNMTPEFYREIQDFCAKHDTHPADFFRISMRMLIEIGKMPRRVDGTVGVTFRINTGQKPAIVN